MKEKEKLSNLDYHLEVYHSYYNLHINWEHSQVLEEKNLENWKNIRGPRPWEDSKTIQEEQRKNKWNFVLFVFIEFI